MKISNDQWAFIKAEADKLNYGEIKIIPMDGGKKADIVIVNRIRLDGKN